jgi:hypothetical protein
MKEPWVPAPVPPVLVSRPEGAMGPVAGGARGAAGDSQPPVKSKMFRSPERAKDDLRRRTSSAPLFWSFAPAM